MGKIVVFANQKGGVAKTSTANTFGQAMYYLKKKVLFIDLDPQCNMTHTLQAVNKEGTIMDVLLQEMSISEAIQKVHYGDCLSSTPLLSSADKKINKVGSEFLLREALAEIKDQYDYIVIDTPPALSILTINAFTACEDLIIPSQPDIYSLQGLADFSQTLESVKKYCNQNLKIAGILITRFNHTNISGEFTEKFEKAADKLNTKVFKSRIRECVAIKEAEAICSDIFLEAPKSNAVDDYSSFIREYLEDKNAEEKN
ncbi:ParA family protein [Leadbettera azotonutricia]|uniref:Sporulation initiation inhibitor protein Soj n=1 Tax=Leadbettera azotonutricia (strain ATCC BAA-888 / DSM 13862 / ZAS-9) TaxID=545695 RepID=F5YDG3_LEAAZ|nr:ParA family protein [Leadbettera azotonutricia]AEF81318.1 sporulation initiation inhibitor protein Soj [Leadbettera azotonutricia ZAS-9]